MAAIFQMHFLELIFKYSDSDFTRVVPKGLINNIPALVQVMVWHRLDDKPLSEPMMVRLQMHTCMSHSASMNLEDSHYVKFTVHKKYINNFTVAK